MNNKQDDMVKTRLEGLAARLKTRQFPEKRWEGLVKWLYANPVGVKKHPAPAHAFEFRFSFAAAGAFAAACVMVFYMVSPRYPEVMGIRGTVKIFSYASNQWRMAEGSGIRLAKNDIVKTFGDGQADIGVKGLYEIRIKDNSEIQLAKADTRMSPGEDIRYLLSKGKAFAYLKKAQKRRSGLTIDTPQSAVSALGTNFMVEASLIYGSTRVGVLDGIVKVQGQVKDMTVLVKAGEGTTVRQGQAPEKPHRLIDYELFELEELYSIGVKPQVALLISSGQGRTEELLSGPPIYISADEKHAIAAGLVKIATDMNEALKKRDKQKQVDTVAQLEKLIRANPDPKYDIQFMLFTGSCYEFMDKHEDAIRVFRMVVDEYPRSPLASIAQYAIGMIYGNKLNDKKAALAAYNKVLDEYPISPEAEEVRAKIAK